jgi:hypothetical protein
MIRVSFILNIVRTHAETLYVSLISSIAGFEPWSSY